MITLVDVRLDDRSPSELCFPETITLKSGRGVFISLAYILAVHGYLINLIVTMLLIRIKWVVTPGGHILFQYIKFTSTVIYLYLL